MGVATGLQVLHLGEPGASLFFKLIILVVSEASSISYHHEPLVLIYAGVLERWSSERYSGPLTVVQLFTLNAAAPPARASGSGSTLEVVGDLSYRFPCHLLVCSSLQCADVYRSVEYFMQMSSIYTHYLIA